MVVKKKSKKAPRRRKPKHFTCASDPEIQREFQEFLEEAQKLQAASDKELRLRLATAYGAY